MNFHSSVINPMFSTKIIFFWIIKIVGHNQMIFGKEFIFFM